MSKASTAPITFSDSSRSQAGSLGETSNADAHFSRLLGVIELLELMAEASYGLNETKLKLSAAFELLSEAIQSSVRELYPLTIKKAVDNSQYFVAPAANAERESAVADVGDALKVRSDNNGRAARLQRTDRESRRSDVGGADA